MSDKIHKPSGDKLAELQSQLILQKVGQQSAEVQRGVYALVKTLEKEIKEGKNREKELAILLSTSDKLFQAITKATEDKSVFNIRSLIQELPGALHQESHARVSETYIDSEVVTMPTDDMVNWLTNGELFKDELESSIDGIKEVHTLLSAVFNDKRGDLTNYLNGLKMMSTSIESMNFNASDFSNNMNTLESKWRGFNEHLLKNPDALKYDGKTIKEFKQGLLNDFRILGDQIRQIELEPQFKRDAITNEIVYSIDNLKDKSGQFKDYFQEFTDKLDPRVVGEFVQEIKSGHVEFDDMIDRFKELGIQANISDDEISKFIDNISSDIVIKIEHPNQSELNEYKSGLLSAFDDVEVKLALQLDSENAEHAIRAVHHGTQRIFDSTIKNIRTVMPLWAQGALGIDRIYKNFTANLNEGMTALRNEVNAGKSVWEAKGVLINKLRGSFTMLLNPVVAIGIAIFAAFMILRRFENTIKQISSDLGVSRAEARGIHEESLRIVNAWDNNYTTLSNINDILKSHREQYGTILDLSDQANVNAINTASALSSQMGVAVGEIYELQQQFQRLGADKEFATNLTAALADASELNGIPFGTIVNDLKEASEMISIYFDGLPMQAARAVIEVRRLGMSMSQIGGIMDKSMDIGGFMSEMVELNALTGGMADLQTFFDIRFDANLTGEEKAIRGAQEIARQFDRMHDSGTANEFTMRKFAEATGMSVDELMKSRRVRNELVGLSEEERALVGDKLDMFSDEHIATAASARQRLKELNTQERMNVAMSKLGTQFMEGILPAVEAFGDIFQGLVPILKIIGMLLKPIGWLIGGFVEPIKWVADWVADIHNRFVDWIGPLDKVNNFLEDVTGHGHSIKDVVKGIGMLLGVLYFGWYRMLGPITKKLGILGKQIKETLSPKSIQKSGDALKDAISPKSIQKSGDALKGAIPDNTDVGDTISKTSKAEPSNRGEGVKTFLTNLAEGLRQMGTGPTIWGATALLLAVPGLIAMVPGFVGAKLVEQVNGERLKLGLSGLAEGLRQMGTGQVILGALALIPASIGLIAMIPASAGLAALSLVAPKAVPALTSLGTGLAIFGKLMATGVGALGLILLTGAAIGLGYALNLAAPAIEAFGKVIGSFIGGFTSLLTTLSEMSTRQLIKVGISLYALAGSFALTAKFAPAIILASAAFAVLFAVLNPKATENLESLFSTFSKVSGDKLKDAASGLISISYALTHLALASITARLFGSGNSMVSELQKLASVATPIMNINQAIGSLADNIERLSSSLTSLNIDKLKELKNVNSKSVIDLSTFIGSSLIPQIDHIGHNVSKVEKSSSVSVQEFNNEKIRSVDDDTDTKDSKSDLVLNDTSNTMILYELRQLKKVIEETLNRPVNVNIAGTELKTFTKLINSQNNNR